MTDWIRVSKSLACPVCGHTDWCLIAEDGSAAICPRIESDKRCGDAGWLHRLTDQPGDVWRRKPRSVSLDAGQKVRAEDIEALSRQLQAEAGKCGAIDRLAAGLDLSVESLIRFSVGWSISDRYSAWPMFDHRRWIVGINRRFADGSKKVMPGHRAGLYVPADLPDDMSRIEGLLLVCEGATDAVAALDLGLWSVGRFSCTHGAKLLVKLVERVKPARLVLVGDTDEPGRRGVESLASVLLPYVRELRVVYPPPPHKDLRAWKRAGATLPDVIHLIDSTPPRRLVVEVRSV